MPAVPRETIRRVIDRTGMAKADTQGRVTE